MSNSDIKQHISVEERIKWNKNVDDLVNHLGSGGVNNHALGDGSIPGFSTNDFTNEEKIKLANIEEGALNNPHPETHPYTMITGLGTVAHSNDYEDLNNKPTKLPADGGDSDTVGGIRITISSTAPANPNNLKELWLDTSNWTIKTYNDGWITSRAAFA
jgi:hypothetical protein